MSVNNKIRVQRRINKLIKEKMMSGDWAVNKACDKAIAELNWVMTFI